MKVLRDITVNKKKDNIYTFLFSQITRIFSMYLLGLILTLQKGQLQYLDAMASVELRMSQII